MLTAITLILATFTAHWDTYTIPAGSMKPTLLVGDYIVATPSTGVPRRGTVVVFDHPLLGLQWVKRVIAVPGDRIAVEDGVPVINGIHADHVDMEPFVEAYTPQGPARTVPRCLQSGLAPGALCDKRQIAETLPGGPTYPVLDLGVFGLDTVAEQVVPDGHVFVMGDNRDNSVDSRLSLARQGVGMVPIANIRARVSFVLISTTGRHFWNPVTLRTARFMVSVQ